MITWSFLVTERSRLKWSSLGVGFGGAPLPLLGEKGIWGLVVRGDGEKDDIVSVAPLFCCCMLWDLRLESGGLGGRG